VPVAPSGVLSGAAASAPAVPASAVSAAMVACAEAGAWRAAFALLDQTGRLRVDQRNTQNETPQTKHRN